MVSPELESVIKNSLSLSLSKPVGSLEFRPVGGGSINTSYQLKVDKEQLFFCKINSISPFPGLFEKEKKGLELLGSHPLIRVPRVIASNIAEDKQILILEWIDQGIKSEKFWKLFGEQLANLHRVSNDFFGLEEDNYMGALHQSNHPAKEWTGFLIRERFNPQISLALKKNLLEASHANRFGNLFKNIHNIFPAEIPSLLHGDLWSGNFLCDETGLPVLIDPAVYFGHRSMDLGMTTLFGGFDEEFYDSYQYHFPFPNNYREQWDVCNLYPLLIHLNLFGRSYLSDILHTLRRY